MSGISEPGHTVRRVTYPDPTTGEPVTGYRKQAQHTMYRDANGKICLFAPPLGEPERSDYIVRFDAALGVNGSLVGLQIVSRKERREMYREDSKRYKAARKKP